MADGLATSDALTRVPFDGPPKDDAATRERVWARVQLARNVRRPHTLELVGLMAEDVIELHGDRLFGDDPALVGGFATLAGQRLVFIGHQKGGEVDENIRRNFGMPHPDGYRKAMRLMHLAERLGLPIVTFVDTPGASPDAASEERGQAEAIASSIATMTRLRTPVITVITGEGGSGGALAIAVGDVVLALENAIYSVISPEGCASILWRTPDAAQQAAVAMRLTAADQLALGVVDEVVPEPAEGAHLDPEQTARALQEVLVRHLQRLVERDPSDLVEARYRRYRQMGSVRLVGPAQRPVRPRKRVGDRLRELLAPSRPPRREDDPDTTPGASRPTDLRAPGDLVESHGEPPLHEEI
jgi:acetyl-CoA carboxylase carboxyl transferase subunit alpha